MVASGVYNGEFKLVEVVELPSHPYFIASQYHPEFISTPNEPSKLFSGLIAAAIKKQQKI